MPSASTGIGVTSRPASSTISRWACQPGSSSATCSIPLARSQRHDQREPLAEARADQEMLRVGGGAADAAEIVGERRAQLGNAARVAVADRVQRRLPPGAA